MSKKIMMIAHTGVWTKYNEKKLKKRISTAKNCIIQPSNKLLLGNIDNDYLCVDLVELAINVLENSGLVNAGVGSASQKDGVQRMDASIMRGNDLEYGAVGSLRGFQNPISIARFIMETKDGHNMYAHDFAEKIANENGFKKIEQLNENENNMVDDEFGTVGCCSCDNMGILCAGTSTGGFGTCEPGRIGDSCIVGAGTYANEKSAVSCTGRGENSVKLCVAKRVVDLVSFNNIPVQKAVEKVIEEYTKKFPDRTDTLGIIALDNDGNMGVYYKGAAMVWAALSIENNEKFVLYGYNNNEIFKEKF